MQKSMRGRGWLKGGYRIHFVIFGPSWELLFAVVPDVLCETSRCDFHSAGARCGGWDSERPQKIRLSGRAFPGKRPWPDSLVTFRRHSSEPAVPAQVQWRVDRFGRAAAHLPNHTHQLKLSHRSPAGPGRTVGCARIPCECSIPVYLLEAKWLLATTLLAPSQKNQHERLRNQDSSNGESLPKQEHPQSRNRTGSQADPTMYLTLALARTGKEDETR